MDREWKGNWAESQQRWRDLRSGNGLSLRDSRHDRLIARKAMSTRQSDPYYSRHQDSRGRKKFGAEFDQNGNVRSARTSPQDVAGGKHDWSAFDRFGQMNRDLQARRAAQAGVTVAPPVVAASPVAPDPFQRGVAQAAPAFAGTPSFAGMTAAANAVRATAPQAPAPVVAARPASQPLMQNEIPGRFTDTGGVEYSYNNANGVQERGYDPTKDQTRPGQTSVDPFKPTNWTRTVQIDPKYGGGVGVARNGAGYAPPTAKMAAAGVAGIRPGANPGAIASNPTASTPAPQPAAPVASAPAQAQPYSTPPQSVPQKVGGFIHDAPGAIMGAYDDATRAVGRAGYEGISALVGEDPYAQTGNPLRNPGLTETQQADQYFAPSQEQQRQKYAAGTAATDAFARTGASPAAGVIPGGPAAMRGASVGADIGRFTPQGAQRRADQLTNPAPTPQPPPSASPQLTDDEEEKRRKAYANSVNGY